MNASRACTGATLSEPHPVGTVDGRGISKKVRILVPREYAPTPVFARRACINATRNSFDCVQVPHGQATAVYKLCQLMLDPQRAARAAEPGPPTASTPADRAQRDGERVPLSAMLEQVSPHQAPAPIACPASHFVKRSSARRTGRGESEANRGARCDQVLPLQPP